MCSPLSTEVGHPLRRNRRCASCSGSHRPRPRPPHYFPTQLHPRPDLGTGFNMGNMGPLTGLTVVAPAGGCAGDRMRACGDDASCPDAAKPSPLSPRSARTAAALADVIRLAFLPLFVVVRHFVAALSRASSTPSTAGCAGAGQGAPASAGQCAPATPTSADALSSAYCCHPLPLPPPCTPGRLTVSFLGSRAAGGGRPRREAK